MPEEKAKIKTALYMCFDHVEIFDDERFKSYLLKLKSRNVTEDDIENHKKIKVKKRFLNGMIIANRFYVTRPKSAIFTSNKLNGTVTEFIVGNSFCFVIKDQKKIKINKKVLKKVETIGISHGLPFPKFEKRRQFPVTRFGDVNVTSVIGTKSYSYTIEKLEFPYRDKCINYTKVYRVGSQFGAKVNCKHARALQQGMVAYDRFVSEGTRLINLTIQPKKYVPVNETSCEDMFPQPACYRVVYLTQTFPPMDTSDTNMSLIFEKGEDNDPSFTIKSKPRIENIDYVTYILGALGSWIGFSFAGINPVPIFLIIEETKTEGTNRKNTKIELTQSKKQIACLKRAILYDRERNDKLFRYLIRNVNIHRRKLDLI